MSHYNKTMKLNEANLLKTHIYNTINRKTNCYYKTPISKDNIDNEGTIKITKPGYYYLTEDIVFDIPQSTNIHDYLFTKPEKSEHLFGKHAGILIESDCVILDLCGHTISQSARFYAAQRFFNLIQFNNFPFIKNPDKPCHNTNGEHGCPVVGPIPNVLIEEFVTPKYIVIKNGCFGLTSHTAIHGNNNSYIVIENLVASNFEVSMITLNKVEQIVVDCVTIPNSLSMVPFTPFLVTVMLAIKSFLSAGLNISDLSVLHLALKKWATEVDKAKTIDELIVLSKNYPDFDNSVNDYLSPCGQFGMSMTRKGPSVHNFSDNMPSETHSSECIFIVNSKINKLEVNVFEDISIAKNGKPLALIAGSVLRIVTMEHPLTQEILRLLKTVPIDIRKTISPLDDATIDNILSPSKDKPFELCRGIDNMAHTSKGVVAIRLDDCIHASMVNVHICDLNNIGKPLSDAEIQAAKIKYYSNEIIMMNSTLLSPNNYVGNNSCGILMSSGKNYTLLCSSINNVKSKYGCAIGLGINNSLECAFVEDLSIKDIDSDNNKNDSGTLLIDEDSKMITLNRVTYN